MARYIDAEICRRKISDERNDDKRWNEALNRACRIVCEQPTLDAVPVVRCKDCKHSDTFPVCGEPHSFPLKCLSIRYGGVFEDWFCEHGERR